MRHLFLLLMLTCGVVRPDAAPIAAHEAYVWQRQWTPELAAAVVAFADLASGYRVLVAEADREHVVRVDVDWDAFARPRRSVTLVVRIDGASPRFAIERIAALIDATHTDAIRAGVEVTAVEIDHDCATARLAGYAGELRELRQRVNAPLRWSITALPDWMRSPALPALLDSVDGSVLQVHAVAHPRAGLFDAGQALRWIRAYARLAPKPFRVALPAYATRVSFGDDGRIVAIESDATSMPRFDADAVELAVDPRRVAVVLQRLRAAPPARYAGVAWFRLPLASDRRSWSISTLRALIAGDDVASAARAELVPVGANFDVVLRNPQTIDVLAPRRVALPADCTSGDGVAGYRFEGAPPAVVSDAPPLLKPGAARTIAWTACTGTSPP